MTRDTVWQDDPPFAVGEAAKVEPATDEEIAAWLHNVETYKSLNKLRGGFACRLIARIKAERERFQELRDNYTCGDEYEAGLWSRRNIEAFFRDQEGKS